MKISEVMTTEVETVSADQTAREAASFMLRADAGSIPVCEGDKLIGMITDRDIAVRGVAEGRGPDTPVQRPDERRHHLRPRGRRCRGGRAADERGAGPPPAGARCRASGWSGSSASATSPAKPSGEAAHEALEGVSAPRRTSTSSKRELRRCASPARRS